MDSGGGRRSTSRCVAVGSQVEPISCHLNQNHSKDEGECLSSLSLLLPLVHSRGLDDDPAME